MGHAWSKKCSREPTLWWYYSLFSVERLGRESSSHNFLDPQPALHFSPVQYINHKLAQSTLWFVWFSMILSSYLWGLDNVMLLQFIYKGGIISAMAPPGHVGGWGGQLPHQKSEVGRCYSAPHHLILIHLQPLAVPLKHLSRASIMSCVKLGCAHGVVRPSRLSNMEGWDGARGHTAISVSGKSSLMESCLNPFKQNHTVAGILQTFPNGTTHMTTSGFRQSYHRQTFPPAPPASRTC